MKPRNFSYLNRNMLPVRGCRGAVTSRGILGFLFLGFFEFDFCVSFIAEGTGGAAKSPAVAAPAATALAPEFGSLFGSSSIGVEGESVVGSIGGGSDSMVTGTLNQNCQKCHPKKQHFYSFLCNKVKQYYSSSL